MISKEEKLERIMREFKTTLEQKGYTGKRLHDTLANVLMELSAGLTEEARDQARLIRSGIIGDELQNHLSHTSYPCIDPQFEAARKQNPGLDPVDYLFDRMVKLRPALAVESSYDDPEKRKLQQQDLRERWICGCSDKKQIAFDRKGRTIINCHTINALDYCTFKGHSVVKKYTTAYKISIRGEATVRVTYYSGHNTEPRYDTVEFHGEPNENAPKPSTAKAPLPVNPDNPPDPGAKQINRSSDSSLRRTLRNATARLECITDRAEYTILITLTYRPEPMTEDCEVIAAAYADSRNQLTACHCLKGCSSDKIYIVGAVFDAEKANKQTVKNHGRKYQGRARYMIDDMPVGTILQKDKYCLPHSDIDSMNRDIEHFEEAYKKKICENAEFCAVREPQNTGNWHVHLLIYHPNYICVEEKDSKKCVSHIPTVYPTWVAKQWKNAERQSIAITCGQESFRDGSLQYLVSYLQVNNSQKRERLRFYPFGHSPITFSRGWPRPDEFLVDSKSANEIGLLLEKNGYQFDEKCSYVIDPKHPKYAPSPSDTPEQAAEKLAKKPQFYYSEKVFRRTDSPNMENMMVNPESGELINPLRALWFELQKSIEDEGALRAWIALLKANWEALKPFIQEVYNSRYLKVKQPETYEVPPEVSAEELNLSESEVEELYRQYEEEIQKKVEEAIANADDRQEEN